MSLPTSSRESWFWIPMSVPFGKDAAVTWKKRGCSLEPSHPSSGLMFPAYFASASPRDQRVSILILLLMRTDGLAEMSLPQAPSFLAPLIPSISLREAGVELHACNPEFINSHLCPTTGCGSSIVGMRRVGNTALLGLKGQKTLCEECGESVEDGVSCVCVCVCDSRL